MASVDPHASGVAFDDRPGCGGGAVGDDHGGSVAAEAFDHELADGAWVGGQADGGLVDDFGGAVVARPVETDGLPHVGGLLEGGDLAHQRRRAHAQR
jgi:hypothetical protein